MPVSGGTTRKFWNASWPQRRNVYRSLLRAEFKRGVQIRGIQFRVVIDLHRMVDDELDRLERIDLLRVAAEADDAVAHGREIDNGGNAGEVLQQHARGRERDLFLLRWT